MTAKTKVTSSSKEVNQLIASFLMAKPIPPVKKKWWKKFRFFKGGC